MSLAIKHGLFKLNMTDYHAILGVSLDADPKQIRLRYLKIAQKLHPDKCRKYPDKMRISGQILSKLVNPAYEQLSRKSNYVEHQLVLTQIGKRLAENKDKIVVNTEAAKELLKAGSRTELAYPQLLKKISTEQYKSIEKAGNNIGAISELNLVYLMWKCDRVAGGLQQRKVNVVKPDAEESKKSAVQNSKSTVKQSKATTSQSAHGDKNSKLEEPTTGDRVSAFVGRAQQYLEQGEFDLAITELRDALRIDPNHGVAHAVMGKSYLHKKQLTMAKVHIAKAHKADPHNPLVVESKKAFDKLSKGSNKPKANDSNSKNKSGSSGFFSGFFGARKK